MKAIYYKEDNEHDNVKGYRATISTDGIKTTITEYVDFVSSGLARVCRCDMSFWGAEWLAKSYEARGYKLISK